jgi:hypothetical protein
MAEIGPFADRRAQGARRPPGKEVWQVEQMRGLRPGIEHPLFQPKDLRRLHLRRDVVTDIVQHRLAGFIDPLSLRERPVVHPDDDVLRLLAGRTDGDRPAPASRITSEQVAVS